MEEKQPASFYSLIEKHMEGQDGNAPAPADAPADAPAPAAPADAPAAE